MSRRRGLASACCALGLLTTPIPALAACAPLSLCACVVTASGIAFGAYDPLASTPATSSGTVTVDCVLTVALSGSYDIALGKGGSGSYTPRRMTSGGAQLDYNLYTSPALTQIWGDGTGSTATVGRSFAALLLVSQTTTIYAQIPAGQNVASGVYGDTILVTITY